MRNRNRRILTITTSKPRILPFRTGLVFLSGRVRLHAQTSREDELTNSSTETAQEGVEWLFQFPSIR